MKLAIKHAKISKGKVKVLFSDQSLMIIKDNGDVIISNKNDKKTRNKKNRI